MTPRRTALVPRGRALAVALCAWMLAGGVLVVLLSRPADGATSAARDGTAAAAGAGDLAALGERVFAARCSTCHGEDARGVRGRGPTLRGAGAAAVDFYVSTGRMPLSRPGIEPERAPRAVSRGDTAALAAWITSLPSPNGAGPPIPDVDPARGDLVEGRRLFADTCSGCHQIAARGGIGPGFVAPALQDASPTEIGEAIRVGPYLMPKFSTTRLDDRDVDSIARFVLSTRDLEDRGGWGIGNVGPIPEGLVAVFLAGFALLLVARLIGERT